MQDALAARVLTLELDGLHARLDGVDHALVVARVARGGVGPVDLEVDGGVDVGGHRRRQHEERVLRAAARAEGHGAVAGVDVGGVKHHAADGVRLARKDRRRAILLVRGAVEGDLVTQGETGLVKEAPGHGHLVGCDGKVAVKHVGLVHARGRERLDVDLLGACANGGVAGLHPAALGTADAVERRQGVHVVVREAERGLDAQVKEVLAVKEGICRGPQVHAGHLEAADHGHAEGADGGQGHEALEAAAHGAQDAQAEGRAPGPAAGGALWGG